MQGLFSASVEVVDLNLVCQCADLSTLSSLSVMCLQTGEGAEILMFLVTEGCLAMQLETELAKNCFSSPQIEFS